MKDMEKKVEMVRKLDEIFEPTGYKVTGFDPDFILSNDSGNGGCLLKFSIAERIIQIYESAERYWDSSDC